MAQFGDNQKATTVSSWASYLGLQSRGECKTFRSRVVATDTSMPLRANALSRAWPILPKSMIA
jgi:hypothetical protein